MVPPFGNLFGDDMDRQEGHDKTGGTMMNANHAMTFATVSSVSPWRNEAWARDGSARNVKAMNRTKRLARGQRALAADCIAECWVFISKADVVRAIAVFKFRRVATRSAGKNRTVS